MRPLASFPFTMNLSTLSFQQLFDIDSISTDIGLVQGAQTEVHQRCRAVVYALLPLAYVNSFWMWLSFVGGSFVGEAAIWVASSNRMWAPSCLEIMIPQHKWDEAQEKLLENIAADDETWPLRNIEQRMYPYAESCLELYSPDGHRIIIYKANRPSVSDTIAHSAYSHYQNWFRPRRVCSFNGILDTRRVAVAWDGINETDAKYWQNLGWSFTEDRTEYNDGNGSVIRLL